jgi:hypothetical protein
VTGDMLVVFGFGWMVVGALIGLVLGAKHERHIDALGSAAACGNFVEYHRMFEAYKWRSSVHAHSMLFSLSAVGVGLVLGSPVGSGVPDPVAAVLVVATVTWTLAATRRFRPLMGLADLLYLGAIATVAFGVAQRL